MSVVSVSALRRRRRR
ncbi:hypothetical protein ACCS68_01790 [Rhizobium beringeri]